MINKLAIQPQIKHDQATKTCQDHIKEFTHDTTRKVAICDDLVMTLLTFVTEWYVLYDEFSNFFIGAKWRRFGLENYDENENNVIEL
jgi:hypothetical protein